MNKAFLHFLPNDCLIFVDFSKICNIFSMLHFEKIIQYCKNLAKNKEKPCSTCLKPHFSMALPKPQTRVFGSRYPSLNSAHLSQFLPGQTWLHSYHSRWADVFSTFSLQSKLFLPLIFYTQKSPLPYFDWLFAYQQLETIQSYAENPSIFSKIVLRLVLTLQHSCHLQYQIYLHILLKYSKYHYIRLLPDIPYFWNLQYWTRKTLKYWIKINK